MREIEIKAQVHNRHALLAALRDKHIVLSDPVKQHDVVYGQPGVIANTPGSIWLRIRAENDTKKLFTLKQQYEGGLDSIEHETEIANAKELEAIIKLLGFERYSDLTKYRRKAAYRNVEICVDEVENLGVFIELEMLTTTAADGATVVKKLWEILHECGVSRSDERFEGYDVLMNRKLGKS
jgi:adenylate cyclase class 2